MAASIKDLKMLIELEKKRIVFSKNKQYKQFLQTYTSSTLNKNGNNGKFWDNKFSSSQGLIDSENNKVEKDRNKTAYNWFRSILNPKMSVLNIGCGNGKFESFLTVQDLDLIKYEGMEFASNSLSLLRTKYPEIHFWSGDITSTHLAKISSN